MKHLEHIVPVRLIGGTFAVYQQLKEKMEDFCQIKSALYTAFATDDFLAYEHFAERRFCLGESVDVCLVNLRRLSVLFGGMSDRGMGCAFVQGLRGHVSFPLWPG